MYAARMASQQVYNDTLYIFQGLSKIWTSYEKDSRKDWKSPAPITQTNFFEYLKFKWYLPRQI